MLMVQFLGCELAYSSCERERALPACSSLASARALPTPCTYDYGLYTPGGATRPGPCAAHIALIAPRSEHGGQRTRSLIARRVVDVNRARHLNAKA